MCAYFSKSSFLEGKALRKVWNFPFHPYIIYLLHTRLKFRGNLFSYYNEMKLNFETNCLTKDKF